MSNFSENFKLFLPCFQKLRGKKKKVEEKYLNTNMMPKKHGAS